jgi:hypothetical protein
MIFLNNNFHNWLELSLTGSLYTEFRVGTSTPTAIVVDWGDGSTSSYSGSLMTISHTYSSAFTGNMKISCSAGNNLINRLDSFSESNTLNSITFTTAQIGAFTSLTKFICFESNIISGNLSSLPQTLTDFRVYGSNTIIGNLNIIPSSLLYFYVLGSNIITGDIATLPSGLLEFIVYGSNTTYGNIGSLPTGLIIYQNQGSNLTIGDISTLPVNLTYYNNQGGNQTTGDISSLPVNLTVYINIGNNTTFGNISTLPINLTYYVNQGNSATNGNISTLPVNLTIFANGGSNTTTGNISTLPVNLTYYNNQGSNTTSGSLSNLPVNIAFYLNTGLNTVNDYTAGRTWHNPMRTIMSLPTSASGGLSSTEVDNLLIDLANVATWTVVNPASESKLINISGNNAARTVGSPTVDAAVATLISKGVTVTTN